MHAHLSAVAMTDCRALDEVLAATDGQPKPAGYEKHARLQHAPGQQRCLASMP
jgi:hypothetical protein